MSETSENYEVGELLADLKTKSAAFRRVVGSMSFEGEMDPGNLATRLEYMQELWTTITDLDTRLRRFGEIEPQSVPYLEQDEYATLELLYLDNYAAAKTKLYGPPQQPQQPLSPHQQLSSSGPTINVAQFAREVSERRMNVPPIDLPSFDGSYREWPTFHDYFSALFINSRYTDVERLHYLKKCVHGEAAIQVKNYKTTAANFQCAWQKLTNRFSNKKCILAAHLEQLFSIKSIKVATAANLRHLVDEFSDTVDSLKNLGRETAGLSNDILVYMLLQKLDADSRERWELEAAKDDEYSVFDNLVEFLNLRAVGIEASGNASTSTSGSAPRSATGKLASSKRVQSVSTHQISVETASSGKNKINKCLCCSENHSLHKCPRFRERAPKDRLHFAKAHNVCTNCLTTFHRGSMCRSKFKCALCGKRHNTLLHQREIVSDNAHAAVEANTHIESPKDASVTIPQSETIQSHFSTGVNAKEVILATAWVLVSTPSNKSIKVRALLDQGSTHTFLTKQLADALRMRTYPANATVSVIGDQSLGCIDRVAPISVSAIDNAELSLQTNALIVERLTSYTPRLRFPLVKWTHLTGLKLADDKPTDEAPINLLIGADLYAYALRDGIRRGQVNEPVAQNIIFGWILSGSTSATSDTKPEMYVHYTYTLNALSQQISKFWEIEKLPDHQPPSEEDVRCENHFRNTFSRNLDGRFVVRIPFKTSPPLDIGATRARAERVLLSQEKRHSSRPEERKQYSAFLREYEALGHMRRVRPPKSGRQVVYLPHHAVIKSTSTTTKVRIVFNASSPSSNKKTLNDMQMAGPKLQQDLGLILTRWRCHRVVCCADIEKMFRQILVDDRDLDYQRILWRYEPTDPVNEFQLLTVTYGTASAPFLALRVIQQLASDEGPRFPQAAKVLLEQTFVDDCLFGADSVVELRQLRDELIALLKLGCFTLRKWASSHPQLLTDIDPDNHGLAFDKPLQPDDSLHILGIAWNPTSDSYRFTSCTEMPVTTKREILSVIARLFDPLGWLAPVVVEAKIFMKTLWKLDLGWDEPIPEDLVGRWYEFYSALPMLNSLKIPRWLNLSKHVDYFELHGFSDASTGAYAAVVYLRVEEKNGTVTTHLLGSKTRVAPEKVLTIARLELCGAVLLSQLLFYFRSIPTFNNIPVYCWTDATNVLAWLAKDSSHWKIFIAHRVATIHTLLDGVPWRHVPGTENPADLASRGVRAVNMASSTLWWHGPHWLRHSRDEWPSDVPPVWDANSLEEKEITHANLVIEPPQSDQLTEIARNCSSWPRLLRASAYLLRYSPRHRVDRHTGVPAAHEVNRAELRWILAIQARQFPVEIGLLKDNEPGVEGFRYLALKQKLPQKSPLRRLNPMIDSDGLLRVGGRLSRSNLPMDARHPIILNSHPITRLLVREAHQKCLHGGMSLTLSTLRNRFWIIQARKLVKSEVYHCVICERIRAEIPTQLMGNLPPVRVDRPKHAFANTGVDYAGPVRVRMAGGRGIRAKNVYIAVFICLATKAVHLELVSEYSSAAFLAALDRFCARRGLPSIIYNDRGTNFQGADAELREAFLQATHDEIVRARLASDRIAWKFIPPAAPHFGGLWEAGVKAMKRHLRRVLANSAPTFEELTTLLCRIEACMNSRPLGPLNDGVDGLDTLTPAHLLLGHPVGAIPAPSLEDVNINRLSRWKYCQQMLDSFWQRWSDDYVRSCQHRTKWNQRSDSLRIGQIVLLRNENLPPTKWQLGRIVECHPGLDGLVRVVTVKTSSSVLKRPITKLALLPIDIESNLDAQPSSLEGRNNTDM